MLKIHPMLGHALCFQDLERKYGANSKEFHGVLYLLERTIPKVSYPWWFSVGIIEICRVVNFRFIISRLFRQYLGIDVSKFYSLVQPYRTDM